MAGNGHEQSGRDRLDRMETILDMLVNDHVQFREEHKMLLQAQVLLSGSLEVVGETLAQLTVRVDALTVRMDVLTVKVDALTVKVDALTDNAEAMRANFDARLKRLES